MFPCPHCQQPIEIGIGAKGGGPWYRLDPGNPKVSLGCGTLLVIGVIVWLCSGGFQDKDEIRELRGEIQKLTKKVDALTEAVKPVAGQAEAIQLP